VLPKSRDALQNPRAMTASTLADWLLRLTQQHRTWGFGLCFLYLRKSQAGIPDIP